MARQTFHVHNFCVTFFILLQCQPHASRFPELVVRFLKVRGARRATRTDGPPWAKARGVNAAVRVCRDVTKVARCDGPRSTWKWFSTAVYSKRHLTDNPKSSHNIFWWQFKCVQCQFLKKISAKHVHDQSGENFNETNKLTSKAIPFDLCKVRFDELFGVLGTDFTVDIFVNASIVVNLEWGRGAAQGVRITIRRKMVHRRFQNSWIWFVSTRTMSRYFLCAKSKSKTSFYW